MKSLKAIAQFLLAAVLLISCGGDDEPESASGLEGTWTAITMNYDITQTNSISGQSGDIIVEGNATDINYDLTLEDGTYRASGMYTLNYTFSTLSQVTELVQSVPEVFSEGTYSVDGNEITVFGDFYGFDFQGLTTTGTANQSSVAIFEVDGDMLTLTQNQSFETVSTGLTVTTNIVSKSTWTRK